MSAVLMGLNNKAVLTADLKALYKAAGQVDSMEIDQVVWLEILWAVLQVGLMVSEMVALKGV